MVEPVAPPGFPEDEEEEQAAVATTVVITTAVATNRRKGLEPIEPTPVSQDAAS
jgi:hypothetical protein